MCHIPGAPAYEINAPAFFAAIIALYSSIVVKHGRVGVQYRVGASGGDDNPGTEAQPFCTIQHAIDVAQPGDVITGQAGIYRERINPSRGREAAARRIGYQAVMLAPIAGS